MYTEQGVPCISMETARGHIISIELSHLWEDKRSFITEEFLHLLGTQGLITGIVFTGANHLSISWALWIKYTPSYAIFMMNFNTVLSSLLPLGLLSSLFPYDLSPKLSMYFYVPCVPHAFELQRKLM